MEPSMAGREASNHDDLVVRNWRAAQLQRLRIPGPLGEVYADDLDWHQMAQLVQGVWRGAMEEERRVLRSNPIGR